MEHEELNVLSAEGILIIVLVCISLGLFIALIALFSRYQRVTQDSIKGFSDILAALNSIRSDLQIGDNLIADKVNDTHKRLYEKIDSVKAEVVAHLQYIRDKTK